MSLLEPLVKIQEHLLAENHLDRLASQRELARIYQANGQVKEAMFLLEQVGQDQGADINGGPSFSTNDTAPARNIQLGSWLLWTTMPGDIGDLGLVPETPIDYRPAYLY